MKTKFIKQATAAALSISLCMSAFAATTSKATDSAPKANEIEWLDFSDYDKTQVTSSSGQLLSFTTIDGLILSFRLKQSNPLNPDFGTSTSPNFSTNASFGRTGYKGISGSPLIYGYNNGTLEFSDIQLSDSAGNRYAFEWITADAETTARSRTHQERQLFTTNGGNWTEIANLTRVDGSANVGILDLSTPELARIYKDVFNNEGGAYILGTQTPSRIFIDYGSDSEAIASRQAIAFGLITSKTVISHIAPAAVPANNPLAILILASAMVIGTLSVQRKRKARKF
ncbi:hypothetical protein E9531_02140 [Lampropedia puyangensis]|uniref:Surface adhesin CshA non-repetitive domain-containing protein n=1 Tax=Lampropedia puyangensis TaxID=1330072 RepID=A0A4S8FCN7_9BURK|nr:CshA/CshB family fibrillar adhesin-related protein [Lampropedia puyangensis]THU05358.1 hypothetical protein E9531_02140 [Lampropedia puyangensis]